MNLERAIEIIKVIKDRGKLCINGSTINIPINDVTGLAASMVIDAAKKQIPKKPWKDTEVPNLDFCECGTEVTYCMYCPNCGQALEWE